MGNVPKTAVRRQIIALIPVYMNTMMNGCSVGWFSNALYYLLGEARVTLLQCGLMTMMNLFAQIIFSIPAGILADKYGRKMNIIGVSLLEIFVWLVLSLDTSIYTFYITRFILGVSITSKNATSVMTVGEIASPEIRGKLSVTMGISFSIGIIVPSLVSISLCSYEWLTWSAALLSAITLLSMFWATETPNFLISVSKLNQAKCNLQRIRQGYPENEINDEFEKLQKYIEDERTRKRQSNWIKFLKSKSIRKPLIIGILVNFLTVATGPTFLTIYSTVIIPANNVVPRTSYPLIIQILNLFASTTTVFYVENVPRRTILLFGAAVVVLFNASCALSQYFIYEDQNEPVFKWLFTLGNILVLISCNHSLQSILQTLNSELYPQAVKGFCGSLAFMSQSLSLIILVLLYNLTNAYSSLYLMYVMFSISSIILFLVVYFLLPEGRGQFLTDLQMKFKEEPSRDGHSVGEKNQT